MWGPHQPARKWEAAKEQDKSRGTLKLGTWLAAPRPPPKPSNMWLSATRLIVDLPSSWDEPANESYLVPLV